MKPYIFILSVFLLFISCVKDDVKFDTEADILKYIQDNNLNAIKSNSGLYYVIDKEGTGKRPSSISSVTVAYKGSFLNNTVFDQSTENGATFSLNRVIAGWTEGIQYFKEGGEGKLLVPYYLGYGTNGRGSIPGGAALVFDIKLIRVN